MGPETSARRMVTRADTEKGKHVTLKCDNIVSLTCTGYLDSLARTERSTPRRIVKEKQTTDPYHEPHLTPSLLFAQRLPRSRELKKRKEGKENLQRNVT